MEKRFISISELSQYLSVNHNTIRCWLRLRDVPSHRFGRLVRFDLREIETWAKEKRVKEIT